MYTLKDTITSKQNNTCNACTTITRNIVVWLVAMLAALVYIGCEEPSSDISTPSVVGTPALTSTPLGSTCVFSRITPVGLSNPVIGADGTVYIATSKALYAIEVDGTGKRQFDIPDMTITTTIAPAIGADGTVYIARGKRLYVIDADGKLKNTLDLASTIATTITKAPAISKDGSTIYIASGNTLYAINADGTLKWLLPYKTTEAITASPSVGSDGVIYIARGKTLYAIDAEGKLKNTLDLSSTITEAITHSPVVDADGVIYIASGKTLYAINAEGTELLRQFDISDTITTAPAVSRDAVVYVGTENGCLYAIDVDVARKKYRTGGAVVSSPAIGKDGTIYVGSDDSNLYAIARDGTHLWAYATKGAVRSSPSIGADGTIYVGSDDSKLHAIHGDGTRKWVYATGGQVRSSPSIGADGTIYVGSDDSNLYAIARDGTKRWAYKTEGQVRSSPAIGNIAGEERIYIGSNAPDNRLYVIDTKGETLWKRNSSGAVRSSPALGKEGEVYIGSSDGFVYAYNANGTQRWGYRVGSPVVSSPAIMVDDKGVSTIIIGTVDGLHAIDAESGINQWTKAEMGHVRSSPAIGSDGTIYVGAENGNFYRLDENGEIEKEEYIGSVGLSSPVIGDEQVIIGTQTGIVYVIESEATGYAESSWPGRGHDGLHSGRGVPVEGFEGYELRAPTLDSPKSIHYNRFKVLLNYTDEMAGNNKVGAPLSVNDVEMTLYYSTTNTFPPAIPASSFSQNTADKGRVTKRILTTLTTNTIETPALLRENTDYYYMIQATQVRAPKQTRYSNMIQVKTPYEPTAPGRATGLTANTTKTKELTFKADIPSHFGKKADNITPVAADEVKYWLYYARVGYTPSGKAKVTTTTNAAAVVQAVGKVTNASNKNVGRIDKDGDSTRDTVEFALDGLTGGVQYRYTIITIHRNDAFKKSDPAPAKTATVKSEATVPGAVTIQVPDTTTKGQLTFHVTAPTVTGKKADGITDVLAANLKYWLYYARVGYSTITDGSTADEVERAVGTATDAGRIEQDGSTITAGFELDGLTGGTQYRYTVVVVHPEDDALKSALTPAATATVKSEATAPGMVTIQTPDTTTERQLTFKANPPVVGNHGTKKDGRPVAATDIIYRLYYARVGYTPPRKAQVTASINADAVVQAVGAATGASNKNVGRIDKDGSTIAAGFVLDGLTGGAQYRYTVVVIHPDHPALKSTTPANTATVKSEATAPENVDYPSVDIPTAKDRFTIMATPSTVTGTKADGNAVDAKDIIYRLYYARVGYSTITDSSTSADIATVIGAVPNNDAGKIAITGNATLTTTGFTGGISSDTTYRYFIRSIHPNDENLYADTLPFTFDSKASGKAIVISPTKNGKPRTKIEPNEYQNKNITSVTIPDGVTHIGEGAFNGNRLTSVVVPDSVTRIDEDAFGSNQLESVVIPNSVTHIGDYAFGFNQLESVTIGNKVMSIGEGAFKGNKLTSVNIPESVTSIGKWAFADNKRGVKGTPDYDFLKSVTLSKTLYDTIQRTIDVTGTTSTPTALVFGRLYTNYEDTGVTYQDHDGNTLP